MPNDGVGRLVERVRRGFEGHSLRLADRGKDSTCKLTARRVGKQLTTPPDLQQRIVELEGFPLGWPPI